MDMGVWIRRSRGGLICLALLLAACGGEATGAGPVSIPAPISGNLRSSSPSQAGLARIVGSAGAVSANATVQVTNIGPVASNLVAGAELVIPTRSLGQETEVQADSEGAFSAQIGAVAGETLAIVAVDPDTGDESEATRVVVPEHVPPVDFTPLDVAVGENNLAYVLGASTAAGAQVAVLDLNAASVTSTFDVSLSDPRQIAYDSTRDQLLITDPSADTLLLVSVQNTTNTTAISVSGALSVAFDAFTGLAWIGTTDVETGVVGVNLAANTVSATVTIQNESNSTATYLESPSIDVDESGFQIQVVSNFGDGSAQLTSLFWTGSEVTLTGRQVSAASTFAGVAAVHTAQVLTSDSDNDLLLSLDPSEATAPATLAIGSSPREIALDTVNLLAFVANQDDHTVSVVAYTTLALQGAVTVGLNPVSLAYDATTGVLAVVNSGSQSVSLLDADDF